MTTVESRRAGRTVALMLVLTFSTGAADAVGFLALDKVFTGNMTGNVVVLGMGLAGAQGLPVVGPAVALVAFLAGAAAGGRALRGAEQGWQPRTTWLLVAVGAVFAAIAGYLVVVPPVPGPGTVVAAGALAFAMGGQAATARRVAVQDVTTVVVTSTMTSLAADSRLGAGAGGLWQRRATAIVAIGAGAAVGALLLNVHVAAGVGLSALLTWAVAAAGGITTTHTA